MLGKMRIVRGLISIFALAALFSACSIPEQAETEPDKAAVSVMVTGSQGRTVFPQVSLADVAGYKLFGGNDGAEETELAEFDADETTVLLEPGTWNFKIGRAHV